MVAGDGISILGFLEGAKFAFLSLGAFCAKLNLTSFQKESR